MGHEQLDRYYFTRDQKEKIIPKDNLEYYTDPEFNTTHDWLLAEIIAYRKLMDYLQNRLADPAKKINGIPLQENAVKLEWTHNKSALAELIYALHYSGSINHGKGEISKLARAFQSFFDVEIGEIYQIFSEIKMRQKSKTKFLEELAYTLRHEIEKSER